MRRLVIMVVLVLAPLASASAGLEKLIKNVTPSGTMSNITKSSIVSEQEAGHLIGGSVIIKTPAEPGLQLVHTKAPSCRMGGLPCGAQFELLGGGMSVVSSEELVRHVKSMAQNTVAYGSMMLLKSMCSHCEDLMTWLDSKEDWINSLAKTDCEDMAKLADGALGRITAASRATRQSAAVLNGDGRDMADFSRKSKKENDDPTGGSAELESMLGDNFNLVWKALAKKAPASTENNSLKETLMSISGTIIGTKDSSGRRAVVHKKSLVNKEMIEDFIGTKRSGGKSEVNLYSCDETTRCLSPTIKPAVVGMKDSFMGKIQELLASITKKIYEDKGGFSEDEETLIAMSSMPLITKIELDLAAYSSPENATVSQTEFIEALSYDVVTSYLAKLLQETQSAVSELQYAQLGDGGVFAKFDEETRETMRALSRAKNAAFKRYDVIAQSKARLRQEIRHFEMKFEEFLSNQNEN